MELKFRTLFANEIECRIGQQSKTNSISLLLYKDARVDMSLLDETVGAYNWKREHSRDNANCTVSIYDENKKEWVSKEDTGTESNTEKEKGLASDSFKRACVNWGIGRELYTAPAIWIKLNADEINNDGKLKIFKGHFVVSKISYNDKREIVQLEIVDKNKAVRYSFGMRNSPQISTQSAQKPASGIIPQPTQEDAAERTKTANTEEYALIVDAIIQDIKDANTQEALQEIVTRYTGTPYEADVRKAANDRFREIYKK